VGDSPRPAILPYSLIVGQELLRRALEVSYVVPRIGGVLASGERGTAKSTIVRAFALMMFKRLPVTLPINATDDRLVGGWQIDALMRAEAKPLPGLLEQAGAEGGGTLYIDEVNLLDDHLVNLILDVASTGVLSVQRDGFDVQKEVKFQLIGTMNPDEGGLRPQLLDRFGLVVTVSSEQKQSDRREIVQRVLRFEEDFERGESAWLRAAYAKDEARCRHLKEARRRLPDVQLPDRIVDVCTGLAEAFGVIGHRGELVMIHAARGLAAIKKRRQATLDDVRDVAPLALAHRRPLANGVLDARWTDEDSDLLAAFLQKA
jgi:magnesium chelatase subunit I